MITFDNLEVPNARDVLDRQWTGWDMEGGRIFYENYAQTGESVHQEVGLSAGPYALVALANRFNVRKTTSYEGESKKDEEGFVFDGVLWIHPQQQTEGECGGGGRILCWVPENINDLTKLIRGDCKTSGEFEARLVAIRRSYEQQRIEKAEAKDRAYTAGLREEDLAGR